MKKIAVFLYAESWLDRKVKNPKTNNLVKIRSLPKDEREKYRKKEVDDLYSRAIGNDDSILKHPEVSKIKDRNGETPLHELARSRNYNVLQHPDVAKVKDKNGDTPLHNLSSRSRKNLDDLMQHSDFDKVKNDDGLTPLHKFTEKNLKSGVEDIDVSNLTSFDKKELKQSKSNIEKLLKHPNISKVKTKLGDTPLHFMALQGVDITKHPDATKVKNKIGATPLDILKDPEKWTRR